MVNMSKNCISPVVATALLLIVTVVAIVGFQTWYQTFQSSTLFKIEQESLTQNEGSIEALIGNILYVKGENISIEKITIGGNECNFTGNISGVEDINVQDCLDNLSTKTPEIVVVLKDNVISKTIYLDDIEISQTNVEPVFECKSDGMNGFSGGDGSDSNPYQICNCVQLQNINNDLDANYILISDVDCSDTINWNGGAGFSPLAPISGDNIFTGGLDGDGHIIDSLYINYNDDIEEVVGLFAVTGTGKISNLGLENCQILGKGFYRGCLAGVNGNPIGEDYPIISNCYSSGSVTGYEYTGGLVGMNFGGIVNNSHTSSSVNGSQTAGGLVGMNSQGGIINNSYASSSVNGNMAVGGLVGVNIYGSIIERSYSSSLISGIQGVGGLIGDNHNGEILNSYSLGEVSGIQGVGGLIGYNDEGIVVNSYSIVNLIGDNDTGGLIGYNEGSNPILNSYWNTEIYLNSSGGTGLTTNEMKVQSNYVDWDFENIWNIDSSINNGYPYLNLNIATIADCRVNGEIIENGSSQTLYLERFVTDLGNCQSQERTCSNGVLSGDNSYIYDNCTMDCVFNDNIILNGNSINTYLNEFELSGSCQEITRTCTNGVLSGDVSYDKLNCVDLTDSSQSFISVWNTSESGISDNYSITLPLQKDGSYYFYVDWGDESYDFITSYNQAEVTHTYNNEGVYQVNISGNINGFGFVDYESWDINTDSEKLINIEQWGNLQLGNNGYYFAGCSNLNVQTTDLLNLTETTNLSYMFYNVKNLTGYINNWDVSRVVDMSNMFFGASSFNQPLDSWNVSSVTNMKGMFLKASSFNQSLDNWDVSKVTNMEDVFREASSFNQPLDSWNVSSVTNMKGMFGACKKFNQPLNSWDTSSVTNMAETFWGAELFNQPLNNWNVSQVTDMSYMFKWTFDFNQPLNNWNTSSVTKMRDMFSITHTFNQDISSWDVSQVTDMNGLFGLASLFNQPLNNWDVSSVTSMAYMFQGASSFNQNISNWNVSQVIYMDHMFDSTYRFNQDLINWNVDQVKSCSKFNYYVTSWTLPKPNFTNCSP